MIYVVELPAGGAPLAWFAYDDEDFARKVAASDPLSRPEIHDETTPRALLALLGHQPGEPARAQYPAISALGAEHGWDTPLYRADHLLGRGVFRREPVSQREALAAALAARGSACIYWNERDAIGAFEGADPRLAGAPNWRARRALHEQLVALDGLADDN
ncbi:MULTISPECIES: hypothetical protein [Cupriavidus]